jgi:hypothetical protein
MGSRKSERALKRTLTWRCLDSQSATHIDHERESNHGQNGAQGRDRTTDTAIFNRMLYQLSYLGAETRLATGTLRARGVIEACREAVQNGAGARYHGPDARRNDCRRAQPRPSSGVPSPRKPSSSSSSLTGTA